MKNVVNATEPIQCGNKGSIAHNVKVQKPVGIESLTHSDLQKLNKEAKWSKIAHNPLGFIQCCVPLILKRWIK